MGGFSWYNTAMGKLHKIKKAFNRLSDDERIRLQKDWYPAAIVKRKGPARILSDYYDRPYGNYIKALLHKVPYIERG